MFNGNWRTELLLNIANFQWKIATADPNFASRWQLRLMSWFRPRTWPKAGPLPVLVAKRGQTTSLWLCVTPLVFSVPLIAWWHFISRSKLAEFQACGEN